LQANRSASRFLFLNCQDIQDTFEQFNKLISRCDSKLAENIHATFIKKKASRRNTGTLTFSADAPTILKPKTPITSILDIPAAEFARQLTITVWFRLITGYLPVKYRNLRYAEL
jgi:hypothetical protein